MTSHNKAEIPALSVFRPTWEQFQDFSGYISYIEGKGAHKAGVAKVNFQYRL